MEYSILLYLKYIFSDLRKTNGRFNLYAYSKYRSYSMLALLFICQAQGRYQVRVQLVLRVSITLHVRLLFNNEWVVGHILLFLTLIFIGL
jgi:hypothetical protein